MTEQQHEAIAMVAENITASIENLLCAYGVFVDERADIDGSVRMAQSVLRQSLEALIESIGLFAGTDPQKEERVKQLEKEKLDLQKQNANILANTTREFQFLREENARLTDTFSELRRIFLGEE